MQDSDSQKQLAICRKYGADFLASPSNLKVGVALNVKEGLLPINGMRHRPVGDTTGWYIWSGEDLSDDPGFFVPLHVGHLKLWCPEVLKFLGLPSGWRFLIADDYEDVWADPSLLAV